MKILRCPVNGPRPIQEFTYGGEFREMPDPDQSNDVEWAHYIHDRDGEPGVKREWWYHAPSAVWFIAERDTVSDVIHRTYLYGQEGQS